jgi:hypothetical protein
MYTRDKTPGLLASEYFGQFGPNGLSQFTRQYLGERTTHPFILSTSHIIIVSRVVSFNDPLAIDMENTVRQGIQKLTEFLPGVTGR